MNFYASKVERLFKLAKDKIARLTTLLKDAFENMPIQNRDSQVRYSGHQENFNIIKDPRGCQNNQATKAVIDMGSPQMYQ